MGASAVEQPRSGHDDELAAELGHALSRLMRAVSRAKGLANDQGGGRPVHASFPLLIALSEAGPMRSSSLAEAVFSDRSTVSRQVAHLLEIGYVDKLPDPADRRAYRLVLTESGAAALDAHRCARDNELARLTRAWSTADRQTLAALVDRLAAQLAEDLQHRAHDLHR
jgi:DNA-binding MarR family transcriptional regulator